MTKKGLEDLEQFEQNVQWIGSHFAVLKKKYPDNYIAVLKEKVIAHHTDIDQLLKKLEARYSYRVSDLAIKFIPSEPVDLIL